MIPVNTMINKSKVLWLEQHKLLMNIDDYYDSTLPQTIFRLRRGTGSLQCLIDWYTMGEITYLLIYWPKLDMKIRRNNLLLISIPKIINIEPKNCKTFVRSWCNQSVSSVVFAILLFL